MTVRKPVGVARLASRVVVLAAGLVLVAAACSGGSGGSGGNGGGDSGGSGQASQAGARYVSGGGTITTMPPAERQAAPALRGRTLDGKQISLAAFKGKVVVLNVWGSWCPPCRKETPDLVAAAKALRPKGVEFLGINTRDNDPGPAKAFVRIFEVPYPSVYDPHGAQLLGFRDTLPPSAIPSTLVIDRQGRVAARVLGPMTRRTVEALAGDVAESS
jgi:thiol-disulfide isomerase/thioredoxin